MLDLVNTSRALLRVDNQIGGAYLRRYWHHPRKLWDIPFLLKFDNQVLVLNRKEWHGRLLVMLWRLHHDLPLGDHGIQPIPWTGDLGILHRHRRLHGLQPLALIWLLRELDIRLNFIHPRNGGHRVKLFFDHLLRLGQRSLGIKVGRSLLGIRDVRGLAQASAGLIDCFGLLLFPWLRVVNL